VNWEHEAAKGTMQKAGGENGVVLESGRIVESGPLGDLKFYRDMGQMTAA
jgi:hypothetical protein